MAIEGHVGGKPENALGNNNSMIFKTLDVFMEQFFLPIRKLIICMYIYMVATVRDKSLYAPT